MTKRLPLFGLNAASKHVEAFKALAHPGRLDVFFALVRARDEQSMGELHERLGIPGPTLSHHIDQLRRAGLVKTRRQERFVLCSVDATTVTDLIRLLTACC